jgi:hypothetical protein
MKNRRLLESLYKGGLGHHLVLYRTADRVYLGNLQYDRNRLVIKDTGHLSKIKPSTLDQCWNGGVIGMVCNTNTYAWESLTFYGLEECVIKPDLSKTRNGALVAAENQYGDRLIDFAGSIYRGFKLMMENYFLPVILLQTIQSRHGEAGLIVSDLRIVPMDLVLIRTLNDELTKIIEKYTLLDVNDVDISKADFDKMFARFKPGA